MKVRITEVKKKLLHWFFKKEIRNINLRNEFDKKKLLSEIVELESKLEQAKFSIPKRAFKMFPSCEIIGITTNGKNDDEEVYILKTTYDSSLNIYLMSNSYQAINRLPRIMSNIQIDYISKEKSIYIQDIITVDNSIGNGEILMDYFLKTAKALKVKYVAGGLSRVDQDHFDRLEKYYNEKFEFEVKFSEDRTSGTIKKIL